MIYFRVSNNVNIKITDGSLVVYKKIKKASLSHNEQIYCTTYEDLLDIKEVFKRIDSSYKVRVFDEKRLYNLESFPKELGLSNENEFKRFEAYDDFLQEHPFLDETTKEKSCGLFFDDHATIHKIEQINQDKSSVKLAIIGGIGRSIGEIVASIPAVRILYETLKNKFETVHIDIYLNASSNTYYSRDKEILSGLSFIHAIKPLALNFKEFCSYDYFIDNSMIAQQCFYEQLPYVDAYLYKFGLDYQAIDAHKKYNEISLQNYFHKKGLKQRLESLKQHHKVILFHPYSAHKKRSIPIEISKKILKKLLNKAQDYMVVSVLDIEGVNAQNYVCLSQYSKSFKDLAYIISNMDRVITVDTAIYHISEAFFIPTIVLFTKQDLMQKRLAYYEHVKGIEIEDKTKTLSKFIFEDEQLNLYHFDNWQSIKVGKIMKLLEKIS